MNQMNKINALCFHVEADDWNFYLSQLNPVGSDGGSSELAEEELIEEEDPPAYYHLEGVNQPSDASDIQTQTALNKQTS